MKRGLFFSLAITTVTLVFLNGVSAQRNDLGTARMVEALESIINEDGTCCKIQGTTYIPIPDAGASDDTWSLVHQEVAMPIMDAGDTIYAHHIDITNANHTGGTLVGLFLELDLADAQADEVGIQFGAQWDTDIFWASAGLNEWTSNSYVLFRDAGNDARMYLRDVPAAGASEDIFEFDAQSVGAMNSADDLIRVLYIDVTTPNHSNGSLYAAYFDLSSNDPQAFEGGLFINGGFDSHIVMEAAAASPADLPPSGSIGYFTDDQSDWSGGGGNDCALVAVDSSGATDLIATIVLNGPCP